MARETSVVTPQRFQEGFSYKDYIDQIKVNKDRFNGFYNDYPIKPDDAAALKELTQRPNGPTKMLVLGEDWCGDVIRGMPTLARIAEAAGMELSIFPRDLNQDIMNEYLKNGEWMSIPVAVFYTSNHDYRHPGLYGTPALSAIEIACWDIIGKATNQPIYNLLGGKYHEKLRAYAYLPPGDHAEARHQAG